MWVTFALRHQRMPLVFVRGPPRFLNYIVDVIGGSEGRGRSVDEWRVRPGHADNHWLDSLVGAAVAASMVGAVLEGSGGEVKRKRKYVTFAELQQRARARRAQGL